MATTPPRHAFAEERRTAILEMLDRTASVQVTELVEAFGVSAVTVRSDLAALEQDGKLRRTHGGAVSLHKSLTVSVQDKRVNVNARAKQAIARAAIELVENDSTIMVDSGTTALEFVRMLDLRSGITVITADVTIADYIDDSMPTVDVVLLGGSLRKGHRYLYGPLALRSLEMLHADLVIICPGAYLPERGIMTDYPQMAELKGAMLHAATTRALLMDASKVGTGGLMRVAQLEDFDTIVVDEDPDGVLRQRCAQIAETSGGAAPRLIVANSRSS